MVDLDLEIEWVRRICSCNGRLDDDMDVAEADEAENADNASALALALASASDFF
eukprot:CAMPEP_0194087034 /NCGR_PEP_ID=MMETSP0149-20130528/23593_1 /TAXON_ID=122233 /ORGANISM="Chaetoceros debilis, Strain MM31A-1" /LENGTH=53 /DNA_ID=CAMNT_0038770283 /DNA_START=70 /DNA_END=228 /DNA_ORIENTATION=-